MLRILHRGPGVEPLPADGAIWRTCLREVEFLDEHGSAGAMGADGGLAADGQRLEDGPAYQLLLEILCGLRSPLAGETQVLGQFKTFLRSVGPERPWLGRVGQRLLTDAREVRTIHLQGLGSRSYGSAVRRDLADVAHAVVIGTGKLAAEVLPFLSDGGRTVDQWGRGEAPDATDAAGVTYRRLEQATADWVSTSEPTATALIVAAPVAPDVIEAVAARYPLLRRIVDLRADVGWRPIAAGCEVVTLQTLFARMHVEHASALPHLEAARKDIARRARQYVLRDELRPFGWDDLCA